MRHALAFLLALSVPLVEEVCSYYNTFLREGNKIMDEANKDALISEVWAIILDETGKDILSDKAKAKLDRLEDMLDNAMGINENGIKRHVTYGLLTSQ
jgi:hypothetical protein